MTRQTTRSLITLFLIGSTTVVRAQTRPDLFVDDGARAEHPTGRNEDDDKKKKKKQTQSPPGAINGQAGPAAADPTARAAAAQALGGVGLPLGDPLAAVSAAGPGAAGASLAAGAGAGLAAIVAGAGVGGAGAGGAVAGAGIAGGSTAAGGAAGAGMGGGVAGLTPLPFAALKFTAIGAALLGPADAIALTPDLIGLLAEEGSGELMSAAELASLESTAKRLFDSGSTTVACQLYDQAMRAQRTPEHLAALAGCYEKAGRNASAWLAHKALSEVAKEAAARARSATEATRIAGSVARLELDMAAPEHADTIAVSFDGLPVSPAHFRRALPLDPGLHTVAVRANGVDALVKQLTIDAQSGTVVVRWPAGGLAAASAPPLERPWYVSRKVLWTGSLTLLAGVASGAAGVIAIMKRSEFNSANGEPGHSRQDLTDLQDQARLRGQVCTGLAGVALLGAGFTTWFSFADRDDHEEAPSQRASVAPWLERNGAGVSIRGAM